jgi:hypothetical protein
MEYIPKESKNTEKEKNQLKTRKNNFGAPRVSFIEFDEFSENEKETKNETDRFGQKGAGNESFGTNAIQRIHELEQLLDEHKELLIDFKLRTAQVKQKLRRTEKFNVGMKAAIRRIVSTKRDLKRSLAVLTDVNADLDRVGNWPANAFNATPEDEWLVIKIPKANQTHVMCDFCDGGELDNFEWLEGAFKQGLSIRDLIDYKRQRTREERRNSNRMTQIRIFPSELWERHSDSTPDDHSTNDEEGVE